MKADEMRTVQQEIEKQRLLVTSGFDCLKRTFGERIDRPESEIPTEASIIALQILPLLEKLGWRRISEERGLPEIYQEFKGEGQNVDVALLIDGFPVVYIEVKTPRQNGPKAQKQLRDYVYQGRLDGFPISRAVLTDGQKWFVWSLAECDDRIGGDPVVADINDDSSGDRLVALLARSRVPRQPVRKPRGRSNQRAGAESEETGLARLVDPRPERRNRRLGIVQEMSTGKKLCCIESHSFDNKCKAYIVRTLGLNIRPRDLKIATPPCPECGKAYCNCAGS